MTHTPPRSRHPPARYTPPAACVDQPSESLALSNLVPPPLRRPARGGRCASFYLRALLVEDSLSALSLSGI